MELKTILNHSSDQRKITIALLSSKGGAGKTTLSVALAVAHELAGGDAVVIDLDPQGSAGVWSDLRGDEPSRGDAPPRLARALEVARSAGASLALIDCSPREAGVQPQDTHPNVGRASASTASFCEGRPRR